MADMPTMQEIDKREKQLRACVPATWMPTLEPIFAAARRGVEADAEIARLQSEVANRNARALEGDKAIAAFNAEYERAEKAEAELAALKVELDEAVRRELALAEECVNAWRSAVDWSEYASTYFQEKWDAVGDLSRCKAAERRLNDLLSQAAQEGK